MAGIFITTFKRNQFIPPQLSEGINDGLNEGLKILVDFIFSNPGLNAITLSERLKIPLSTIGKRLRVLKSRDYVEYKGSKKTGGYYVKV